jgi:hypothetical protein
MPKTTFTATAPDGSIVKRTSETKAYTHVVLVGGEGREWGARNWCGSLKLAQAQVQQARNWGCYDEITIVPVN